MKNQSLYPPLFWFILGLHTTLWTTLTLWVDMHPDMIDHWIWSRYLTYSYYEHPPMVAWTMRLATLIGGNNPMTLKLGAILFSILLFVVSYRVAQFFYGTRAAVIFLSILEATPYFSVASLFWHIDQPYMLCWLLGLLVMGKYIRSGNRKWILLFGVIAGFGALSKYIMILFYFSLLVWCIFDKSQRKLFLCYEPYVAGILSLIIFSPVLYWNYQHDWASFTYNLEKSQGAAFGSNVIFFAIGHLGLFSPLFTLWFWILLFRRKLFLSPLTDVDKFLLVTAIVPAIFFTYSSFWAERGDPHWLNITYLNGFILLARWIAQWWEKQPTKNWNTMLAKGLILNWFLIAIGLAQVYYPLAPVPFNNDDTTKLIRWDHTTNKILELLEKNNLPLPEYVITKEYQLGAALSLYLPGQPWPYSIEKPQRNQWSPLDQVIAKGGVFLCVPYECDYVMSKARNFFPHEPVYLGEFKTINRNKKLLRHLRVYYYPPFSGGYLPN